MVNCSSRRMRCALATNKYTSISSLSVVGGRPDERASERASARTHLLNKLIETDFFFSRLRRRREHFVFARSDFVCRFRKKKMIYFQCMRTIVHPTIRSA